MQTESSRLRMAGELSSMLHLSVKFCAHALLMFGDDANRATDWLLSDGGRWSSSMPDEGGDRVAATAPEAPTDVEDKLDDATALEDLGMESHFRTSYVVVSLLPLARETAVVVIVAFVAAAVVRGPSSS